MRLHRRSRPREEELAALADGSLAPERRAAVEAEVEASPELRALLEQQRRAVAAMRGASESVEAPARLRPRLEARRRTRAAPALRRPFGLAAGLSAAALAVALVLTLPGDVPGGPTVADAAILATRPATGPGPAPQPSRPTLLARAVDGVRYPNWTTKFGWRATGVRVDTIEGRRATTVFYRKGDRRLGYTIVSGAALATPDDGTRVRREGTEIALLRIDGRPVATWRRGGRTCILSGTGVAPAGLADLAGWTGKGTVPF